MNLSGTGEGRALAGMDVKSLKAAKEIGTDRGAQLVSDPELRTCEIHGWAESAVGGNLGMSLNRSPKLKKPPSCGKISKRKREMDYVEFRITTGRR